MKPTKRPQWQPDDIIELTEKAESINAEAKRIAGEQFITFSEALSLMWAKLDEECDEITDY